ncbi:hypothetical protein SKAU_G00365400 [Synaphobranchus kaupii]|uniref:Myozenin 3 n=1 Tax=Synaphobranchus kaupii TaxID=118154 RepID=A0A9Q1IFC3_SYNKA|nr:hypothetical protein SKAU_G00365400 [Synaphobranchus kaupii]
MLEELRLPSNRGSRMFQERMKRAEMFTLENATNTANSYPVVSHIQMSHDALGGKENVRTQILIQPRKIMVATLDQTVAKKGSPNAIAPGYSRPLKEMPQEKFNVNAKGYCSPWREALGESSELQANLNALFPPQKQHYTHFRCFNRAPIPFGRVLEAPRLLPKPRHEVLEIRNESVQSQNRMFKRPNFNCAPRGWGINYNPESNEL